MSTEIATHLLVSWLNNREHIESQLFHNNSKRTQKEELKISIKSIQNLY